MNLLNQEEMKANSTQEPERIVKYKDPNTGMVNYLVQRKDTEESENWDFRCVEVFSFDKDSIIDAVIRDKYKQSAVEAIISNFIKCDKLVELMQFQNWRDMAKQIADGKYTIEELQSILDRKIYVIDLPFADTLMGGKYEALADYVLKAKLS